jgi:hypothetical protein
MADIRQWLDYLGLGQYADVFEDNDVDSAVLLKLTADDLGEIGVKSVGHRRKLLEAITIQSADSDEDYWPGAEERPEEQVPTPC